MIKRLIWTGYSSKEIKLRLTNIKHDEKNKHMTIYHYYGHTAIA